MAAPRNKKCLYVGGLDRQVTEQILYGAFIPFGPLKKAEIPLDYSDGKLHKSHQIRL
jgi:RNA recognition motif-containing protein